MTLFARHPQTRREVSEAFRQRLEQTSQRLRAALQPRQIRNEETERAQARRAKNRYLVRSRVEGAVTLWDVYELQGEGEAPQFVFGGCAFQEEAIARARDLLLGRVQVAFGSVRAALRMTPSGMLSPDTTIDLPGRGPSKEAARKVVQVVPGHGTDVLVMG